MADNLFDDLQDATFDVVTTTMGYDASWAPSDGSPQQFGRVLFNNPTDSRKLTTVEYDPYNYQMEYKRGVFNGLKEAADQNMDEVVVVRGVEYYVRQVGAMFDGNTLIVKIELKTP